MNPPHPPKPEDTLRTTASSLQLVELVAEHDGATLSDLAAASGMAKSSVHSHLQTLHQYGYVVREGNSYRLGLKLYHLGDYARKRNDLYKVAKEVVPKLVEGTQLEADFTVEENGRVVSLYDESSYSETPSFLVDGRLFHMHSTASGKAILAEYPDERVHEIVEQWGMPAETDRTITDPDALLADLERVRERGYAVNDSEAIEGLWAVGKAVTDGDGTVHGSLNACGPAYLCDADRKESVIDSVRQYAAEFERRLDAQTETGGGE